MSWAGMAMKADRNSQTPGNGEHIPEHRSTGDASAPKATDDHPQTETTEPDALKLLLKQFRELAAYFSYYVTAKSDSAKLSLRNIGLWIVLGTLGFAVVVGVIITASWLLLVGIAEGLGVLFGGRLWAGNITTGFLLLAALGLVMYYAVRKRMKTSRERTVEKYEERQDRQHEEFGHDVSDQAAATPSDKK
jgi:hypothetical protein